MLQPRFDATWPPEIQAIYWNDQREVWDPTLEPQTYRLYQGQLRLCMDLVARLGARTVLDVGCAQGTLALLLAEAGCAVTALDIRPAFLAYARSRYEKGEVRFVEGNVLDRPQLGEFDLVFANQIIEHVVCPVAFIRALAGYVKQAGHLLLTTPNQQYVRCGLPRYGALGDPKRYEERQCSAGGGDHFFAYTSEELCSFVEEAGLSVTERFFFESPWISGHMKVRYAQSWLPDAVLRAADRATLAWFGRRLGHHLGVVARGT